MLGKDGSQVLAWIEQGRRWKTLQPCADVWGAHLVLTPDEVSKLLAELREVLARGGAEKGYREHVEEFVIPELEVLAGEGLGGSSRVASARMPAGALYSCA